MNVTCYPKPSSWTTIWKDYDYNDLELSSYESRTKVDYSMQSDYIHRQMELIGKDIIYSERTSVLQKHDLQITDEVINPFSSVSDDL